MYSNTEHQEMATIGAAETGLNHGLTGNADVSALRCWIDSQLLRENLKQSETSRLFILEAALIPKVHP
jgi:hypothetical protein